MKSKLKTNFYLKLQNWRKSNSKNNFSSLMKVFYGVQQSQTNNKLDFGKVFSFIRCVPGILTTLRLSFGGLILGSSKFLLMPHLPQKIPLTSKVIKIGTKLIRVYQVKTFGYLGVSLHVCLWYTCMASQNNNQWHAQLPYERKKVQKF